MGEMAMNLGLADEIKGNLNTDDDEEVLAAVKCLMNLSKIKRARSVIRKAGLITVLVRFRDNRNLQNFRGAL